MGNVDNIAPYIVLYNSTNVLRKGLLRSNVIEGVHLIGEESKGYACRYFKMMKQRINPTLHTWVVIERVAVDITEFRDISL